MLLSKTINSLNKNIAKAERHEMKNGRIDVSFLKSAAGIYTLAAIINNEIGERKKTLYYVEKVKEYFLICFDERARKRLVDGVAGYL
jgi:hypothetical protein